MKSTFLKKIILIKIFLCGFLPYSMGYDSSQDMSNFDDGSLEEMGRLKKALPAAGTKSSDITTTGKESVLVDYWLNMMKTAVPLWTIVGDAKLVFEGGNTLFELSKTSTSVASISQVIIFKDKAKAISCDVRVLNSANNNQLVIYFDNKVLHSYDLSSISRSIVANLESNEVFQKAYKIRPPSGEVRFQLEGPGKSKIRLDNFKIIY